MSFDSLPEAKKWSTENFKSWEESLTPDEREAIYKWTANSKYFWNINYDLRFGRDRGEKTTKTVREGIEKLDRALKKSTVPSAVVAHRVFDDQELASKILSGNAGPGTVVRDPSFMSTSINSKFHGPLSVFRVRLTVPKGVRGAMVDSISKNPDELELLLPRGSGFRIKSIQPGSYHRWEIEADYLPPEEGS